MSNLILDLMIEEELKRQDEKWGADREQPDYVWLLILVEEIGEVAKAILERMFRDGPISDVDMEVLQTTAVGMQWLKDINNDRDKAEEEQLPGEREQMKRLEAMGIISRRCSWDKFEFTCNEKELAAREKYRELMRECSAWESKVGL
jgi:NTP pyrophosphatase (non-canonical NTP hydrolase)